MTFYEWRMFKAFDFCIRSKAITVPDSPDWLYEIKYDGYRLRLERNGDSVRLITHGGYKLKRPLSVDRRGRVVLFASEDEVSCAGDYRVRHRQASLLALSDVGLENAAGA
jgi:hypothetical protein